MILTPPIPVRADDDLTLSSESPEALLGHPEDIPGEKPVGLRFTQEDWNQMRRDLEAGRQPGQLPTFPTEILTSTTTATAPPLPPPGRLEVELPFESTLSITGRKLIEFDIQETRISAEQAQALGVPQNTQTVEMKQALQTRIQGTVGRKTTVNVNYDDTKENTQDFSVVYKGDPDELIQEAAFGDINLSLPSTAFVNYDKQLFGVKAHLQYKKAEVYAIGSRTKGTTETKRFTGGTTQTQQNINDTSYVRRSFYDLTFGGTVFTTGHTTLPIAQGSELVFMDDQNPFDNTVNTQTFNVESSTGGVVSGQFDQMFPGRDYIIDYNRGVINFLRPLASNVLVAVDYTLRDGTRLSNTGAQPGLKKVLKDINETPGIDQELKTYYNIGQPRIVRDNGSGNFILNVVDLNNNIVGPSIGVTYPAQVTVNFEQGTFYLNQPIPNHPEIYNPTPTHDFTFFLQYQSQVKTYTLRPNIVLQSEKVSLDGRLLIRDQDYIIDYDLGQVTFLHPEQITNTTVIEITYEFAPFGGQLGDTLIGTRGVLHLTPNWYVGSTVLYDFGAKPLTPPDVRDMPQSDLVVDSDTQLKNVKIPYLPILSTFKGEVAQSRLNPDLYDKAIIENFEGMKQEDLASPLVVNWQIASNPDGSAPHLPDAVLSNITSNVSSRNPNVNGTSNTSEQLLQVAYNLQGTSPNGTGEAVSYDQVFSPLGRDFSQKQTFEIWVFGAGSNGAGVDLIADLGLPKEDVENTGVLETEDANHTGFLQGGEDIGWTYHDPGPGLVSGWSCSSLNNCSTTISGNQTFQIGASNGKLDSEDLNKNGRLDPEQMVRPGDPVFQLSRGVIATDPITHQQSTINDLSFTGWKVIDVTLNIQPGEIPNWQAVVALRLTIKNATQQLQGSAAARAGTINLGPIDVVGASFLPAVSTEANGSVGISTGSVEGYNNIDNADYQPLYNSTLYNNLYTAQTALTGQREQALQFSFTLDPGATSITQENFSAPRDLSKFKQFKFFAQLPPGSPAPFTLFLQLGSSTQYLEYDVNVSSTDPNWLGGWRLLTANLVDTSGGQNPNTWSTSDPGATTIIGPGGPPALTQIGQITIGIRNNGPNTITSRIWVDDIWEDQAQTRTGLAQKFSLDNTIPGWGSFGGDLLIVDRNFQTPTTTVTNQDNKTENGYVKFTRLSYLPISYTTGRTTTVTPNATSAQTGSSQLVSILSQGTVNTLTQNLKTQLLVPKMPILGFTYARTKTDTDLLVRTDDTQLMTASLDYVVPWKPNMLSSPLTLRPIPTNISVSGSHQLYFLTLGTENALASQGLSTLPFANTSSVETTNSYTTKLGFVPWDGFRLNPSYYIKTISQEDRFRDDEYATANANGIDLGPAQNFPKGREYTAGLGGSVRIAKWFEPQFSYNMDTTETNLLPSFSTATATSGIGTSTATIVGPNAWQFKEIDRTGTANFNWAFLTRQAFPNAKLFRSFSASTSYLIENGDSYQNVSNDFSTFNKLWVGSPLSPSNPEAVLEQATRRDTLRLLTNWSPFEAYPMPYRLEPLRTMNITNSYTDTQQHTETTGTITNADTVILPDIIITMRDTEKFIGMERYLSNSRLTLRGTMHDTNTIGVDDAKSDTYGFEYLVTLLKKLDISTNYTLTTTSDYDEVADDIASTGKTSVFSTQLGWTLGIWRYTPRFEYDVNQAANASGVLTTDITHRIYSLQMYGDIARPLSLKLPFLRNPLGLANRLLLTTTVKLDQQRTSLDVADNYTDTYSFNISADYSISQNFKYTLGGGYSEIVHQADFSELNVETLTLTTALTIQF